MHRLNIADAKNDANGIDPYMYECRLCLLKQSLNEPHSDLGLQSFHMQFCPKLWGMKF